MQSVKTIRAVERAFTVLRALQQMPHGATLIELTRMTELSGPTLMRLLKTLQGEHAVRRGLFDERWRNTLGTGANVLESTLRRSPFYVRRSRAGTRVNLLMSAVGTAYLTHQPPKVCRRLIDAARNGTDPHNVSAIAAGDLARRLARARKLGYAVRHPLFRGGPYNATPRDDRAASIAVPILHDGVAYGAININWNRRAMDEADMVALHLHDLQQTAERIAGEAIALDVLEHWPRAEVDEP
jgi:IclR family transcriptional regulator, mhp operon transcriptional activator